MQKSVGEVIYVQVFVKVNLLARLHPSAKAKNA
jgi:hypothetical protein